jgi:hypothetical protein
VPRTRPLTKAAASASAGLRIRLQTLVVGPILLALGIKGLVEGGQTWMRTVLWIWATATGSALLVVDIALVLASRRRDGSERPE